MPTIKKPSKKPNPQTRIPVGTEVQFSTLPGLYKERIGTVIAIPGSPRAGRHCYIVRVDKTSTGLQRARPLFMRPYASRLEAQNPTKLKAIK